MLRGFRWQLLAFVVAVVLFSVSLATRFIDTTSDITPVASPTHETILTETPQPTFTPMADVPTPLPPRVPSSVTTYREGLVGSVQRLNPLLADLNPVDSDLVALIFEGLTRINAHGEVVPALARDWVVSGDGLEYVFTLRDDVLWQDGIPFTSADVVYTLSLLGAPGFPGAAELCAFWRTVEIEGITDHLVRFRLAQPLASFPEALKIGILPYHALQGASADEVAYHPFNFTPIGTGPYQLEALRTDGGEIRQVDLRFAPVYRQRPEGAAGYLLERLSFHLYKTSDDALAALQNGEIDAYATADYTQRQALMVIQDSVMLHTTYAPVVGMLIFNWVNDDLPVFREHRVRQALMRGLDRTSLIERHFLNTAASANSPLLPLSWAYEYGSGGAVWPGYDQAAARELLSATQAARNVASDSGEPFFRFTILTLDTPALANMAREIATQWAQLNLGVDVAVVDAETYAQRLENTQFDVALVELSTGGSADPDIYSFWHQGQYPDGKNYGGANDRTISESLERARRDANGLHRRQYYSVFQREFIDRTIAIPLYYPLYTYATRAEVSGIQLGFISASPDRFMTIGDWSIDSD